VAALDEVLAPERLIDLSQPLGPATVLWPGSRPFTADTTIDHDTHGSYARDLSLPEHAGTHVDAPLHFARDGVPTDRIPLAALVRPAVRLDIRDLVDDDASFALSATQVEKIEDRDGEIRTGSAVLVHTGWDRFLGAPERYGGGRQPAFPGVGRDAAQLFVARGVVGVGIDTLGVDPGESDTFAAHKITMAAGLWHAEGLIGLERIPLRGAWIVVGVVPVVDGSGAPARVFAIVP
jgi:kynurenine formamidase